MPQKPPSIEKSEGSAPSPVPPSCERDRSSTPGRAESYRSGTRVEEQVDDLKGLLRYLVDFDDAALSTVTMHFEKLVVPRGAQLLREGQICRRFYFVRSGCLRTYFLTKNGQEKTRLILPPSSIGTALSSFISQAPSIESIDALEDSELLAIDRDAFYSLVERVPAWSRFYQKILEMAYSFQNRRIETQVTLSAQERYQQFRSEHPELAARLSNRVLASYLDIAPETLSRLKSA